MGGGICVFFWCQLSVKDSSCAGCEIYPVQKSILPWFPPWALEKFLVLVKETVRFLWALSHMGQWFWSAASWNLATLKTSHLKRDQKKIPDTQASCRSFRKLKLQFLLFLVLSWLQKWFCTHCFSPLCYENLCLTQSFQMKRLGLKFPHGTNFIW